MQWLLVVGNNENMSFSQQAHLPATPSSPEDLGHCPKHPDHLEEHVACIERQKDQQPLEHHVIHRRNGDIDVVGENGKNLQMVGKCMHDDQIG